MKKHIEWAPARSRVVTGLSRASFTRVFTVAQVRKAAIYARNKKGTFGCLLCGDTWYKNEEHHSFHHLSGIREKRCLLSQVRRRAI